MTSLFRKFMWWQHRRRKENELREELQFHLSKEADERQADGLTEDQAKWAASRDLGNVTLLQEDTRTLWTWTPLEQLAQDLRYALRMLLRNRAFTAVAALSLALGIGANTAIYSFMDSILLRSLPVADPASLVVLNWHSRRAKGAGKAKGNSRAFVVHSVSGQWYGDPKTGLTPRRRPAACVRRRASGRSPGCCREFCSQSNALRGTGECNRTIDSD